MGARENLERHDNVVYTLITKKLPKNVHFLFNTAQGAMNRLGSYNLKEKYFEFPVLSEYFDEYLQTLDEENRNFYSKLEKSLGGCKKAVGVVYHQISDSLGEHLPDITMFDNNLQIKGFAEVMLWAGKEAREKPFAILEEASKLGVPFYLAVPIEPIYSHRGYLLKVFKREVLETLSDKISNLKLFSYDCGLYGHEAKFSKEGLHKNDA